MLEQEELSILEQYKKLKQTGGLSNNLAEPTVAKLRNECATVYGYRPSEEIKKILQSFAILGMEIQQANDILENTDVEKFKPLNNYLKGQIERPNSNTVVLLAWLLDYKKKEPTPKNNIHWFERKYLRWAAMLTVALVIGYLLWPKPKCMYWNGKAYQKINCEEGAKASLKVIALNQNKLINFHKIERLDTISEEHIGKIWYMKVDGVPEFFTDSGMHPVEVDKELKPITKHIIDKYVLKKSINITTNGDSVSGSK